ncbi:MAG: amino acid permease-associated region [Acidobacteriaceae bacterium]|nr:amino acid permease-associated region [Acidobacteriaceae bacterium]
MSEAKSQSASGSALLQGPSGLRRELGLADLALAQILYLTIPEFFGTAAKAGPSHVFLWLLAILLFFIPEALVVARLNRLMPLEGGLYEWARLAFGDRIGFLVAWNLWLYGVIYMALAGLITMSFLAYALGPKAAWIAENKWLVLGASFVLAAAMALLACVGFHVGKWVTNTGSIFTLVVLGALVLMPFIHSSGNIAPFRPLRLVSPPLTLFTLSVFSKMTFGALCGFEYVAIFAGECRNPERNLARSILISGPVIALMYIFGTAAILAFVPPDAVDISAAIPQALSQAFQPFGTAIVRIILPLSVILLLTNYVSTFNINFNGCARLPMVAGWDHLLPAWFTRLHPEYKTPVNSIFFAAGVAMAAAVAVLIGVGQQEAFELLLVGAFAFYATAYLALFAIPLFARRELGIRSGLLLRVGAVSGFLMTLLYIVLSIFPIVDVQSSWEYSAKTAGGIIGANLLGIAIYRWGRGAKAVVRV